MAVPRVTYPLEQAEVKGVHDMLMKHLRGLQAEVRITQEMLKTLPTFCSHPNKTQYGCGDCGADWSD